MMRTSREWCGWGLWSPPLAPSVPFAAAAAADSVPPPPLPPTTPSPTTAPPPPPLPQSTSLRNCLISAFLRGPLQITASSSRGSRKPIDMTLSRSDTGTGLHPLPLPWTSRPLAPSILGAEGPQRSTSSRPTSLPLAASACASWAATVDLPTPPLPERTRTLWRTPERRAAMAATSGSISGAAFPAPAAQTGALGQPAQAEALPASAALVPGQPVFLFFFLKEVEVESFFGSFDRSRNLAFSLFVAPIFLLALQLTFVGVRGDLALGLRGGHGALRHETREKKKKREREKLDAPAGHGSKVRESRERKREKKEKRR